MSDAKKPSCCEMRRKVVIGIFKILPEAECGVPDSVMADYHDFDLRSPAGVPVAAALRVRFCPWCGTKREPHHESRTTEVHKTIETPQDSEGDEWKKDQDGKP